MPRVRSELSTVFMKLKYIDKICDLVDKLRAETGEENAGAGGGVVRRRRRRRKGGLKPGPKPRGAVATNGSGEPIQSGTDSVAVAEGERPKRKYTRRRKRRANAAVAAPVGRRKAKAGRKARARKTPVGILAGVPD